MKKVFILITFITFTCGAFAQNVDLRRKIEVSGTAEQEVTPDIINVSISLQEYINGKNKVTIDQLESQLEVAVKQAGIAKDDFTISSTSAYNNTYQKKKNPDFLASKQYLIKFHDLNKFNQILAGVDPKGIQSTNIDSYDYSKIDDLKRDLKIKALRSAKDKAGYLLASIDEKLGGAIDISEVDNSNYPAPRAVMYKSMAMTANAAPAESDIDFKKIKLSFQINAVFEIVK
ncbi:SIMPL domain-containing protein [Mucilaginibacter sp.]|uniref:SIMPL domain-containing protein n=1 Tax=Mucilaginibacter sp. TaxID=1882438 RepID=UPI003D0E98EF